VLSWYRSLWEKQVGTAVVPAHADLSGYRLVVVPHLYLADESLVARLTSFAEAGGTVVVTYFSGIANQDDHIHLGGYPGAFRDLLGVRVEEFAPVLPGDTIHLDGDVVGGSSAEASGWSEPVGLVDAEARATYVDGPSVGWPAISRAARGAGAAWYVTTDLSDAARGELVDALLAEAQVTAIAQADAGVELVVRADQAGTEFLFAINHTDETASVEASGTDLLTGTVHEGSVKVEAGGVAVLRRTAQQA
jgi:beta-galactosidase